MGVDLGLINQKQQELAAQAAARAVGGIRWWNPKDGSSKIRLMPPWAAEVKSFEKAILMHFGVGQEEATFPCPGPGCPICAHVTALRATNDPGDAELAGRISAKKRYYSNVIDLEDPVFTKQDYDEYKQGSPNEEPSWKVGQTKIQCFGYGAMIYGQLVNLFAQLQLDLTDLETGYDLIITKMGQKLNTKYTVIVAPPQRKAVIAGELMLYNLDAINLPKKPEDMLAALHGTTAMVQPPAGAAPAPSLPPPVAAAPSLPPPAAAKPAPAPAPAPAAAKPAAQVQTMAPPAQEELPSCFKDTETFNAKDVQCAGGKDTDGVVYDPCPGFQPCGEHAGKLVPAAKARRRAAAKVDNNAPSDADLLEQQMKEALRS